MKPMRTVLLVGVVLMTNAVLAVAQANPPKAATRKAPKAEAEKPIQTAPVDAQIAAAMREVSAKRIQATIEKLVSFGTRLTIGPADQAQIDAGHGIGAARTWIKSEFERYSQACGGCLEVKEDRFTQPAGGRIKEPVELVNVYAVQKGTDAEAAKRMYLVTGHYDSRASNVMDANTPAPGANDDGSGTAVSLECARVLSQHKFPATIIFLTVAGEEQGLDGSKHFAEMAKQEGWELLAVLNNDIVGEDNTPGQNTHRVRVFSEGVPLGLVNAPGFVASTPTGSAAGDAQQAAAARPAPKPIPGADAAKLRSIRLYGEENDSTSRQLARYIHEEAAPYLQHRFSKAGLTVAAGGFDPAMEFRPDRFGRGGDHTSFNEEGFAAVRITEWRENYNHQHQNPRTENGIEYGDLPRFVDFDYAANVARVNAATLALLASAPAPPKNVKIETGKQENTTTLKWDAAQGASGYEIVWRDTTSPDWEYARKVGDVTTFTLEMSKDMSVFAVRAVDAKGHRSLAVIPQPER